MRPIAILAWTVKPPLALAPIAALALERSWRALVTTALVVAALTALAVSASAAAHWRIIAGSPRHKALETVIADPSTSLGRTLLHASRWFAGTPLPGLVLQVALATALIAVWRRGLASDDARLLQFALVRWSLSLPHPTHWPMRPAYGARRSGCSGAITAARPTSRRCCSGCRATLVAGNLAVGLPREGVRLPRALGLALADT